MIQKSLDKHESMNKGEAQDIFKRITPPQLMIVD